MTDFIKGDYYKEHKMSEYDFESFGHTANSNVNSGSQDNLLFGDMPSTSTNSASTPLSSTSSAFATTSTGIDEFGTSKVDNSKVEDIFIDLDHDGINDLSYADPVVLTDGKPTNTSEKKPKRRKKKSSNATDTQEDNNDNPINSDDDNQIIIKY